MARNSNKEAVIAPEKSLIAIAALLAGEREDRIRLEKDKGARRTEVILSEIGLQPVEIGLLVGKTPNAVQKTISRSKGKTSQNLGVDVDEA